LIYEDEKFMARLSPFPNTPGFTATEMVKKMPADVLKSMEEKVPLKRLGLPEEIAATYAFLSSDDAAYINGTVISVDGGITI
jgi:3-oxoacyl-[acyl-carrier protein] reductase